jgi:methionyl-tRNA formyltransferase
MIRVGFIGRTKILYEAIKLFQKSDLYEISFIWTCKDEEYYDFPSKNFEQLAKEIGCKYVYSANIKNHYNQVSADIVISINFINLISKEFIESFKYGILNAHAGDLPRYKGNACPNWSIINSEEAITMTIHQMDKGLDSGPIVIKKKYPIDANTYITDVYLWFQNQIPSLFINAAEKVIKGDELITQKGRGLRTFPRKPEDAALDFKKNLEWNYKLIRASSRPFSGAYAFLNNSKHKVVIYKAEPHKVLYDFFAISGQIMEKFDDEKSFLIAIGHECLKITDFSLDGATLEESYNIICKSLRNRLC